MRIQQHAVRLCAGLLCLLAGFMPVVAAAASAPLVAIETSKGQAYCQLKSDSWLAGSVSNGKFKSFSQQISALNRQLANASKKKQKTIKQKIRARKLLFREAKLGCAELEVENPSASPTPGPTPSPSAPAPSPSSSPTPSPSASPSASPRPACYDAQRNTSCFGIPSPLVGNESAGANLFEGCKGCHSGSGDGGKRNKSYTAIVGALTEIPQMQPYSDSYNAQDIAHLTAYLNRFNPAQ